MSTTTGHHTHSTHNAHSTPQSTLHTYTRINGTILLASTISHSNRITRVQEDERLFESIYYFFFAERPQEEQCGRLDCMRVCVLSFYPLRPEKITLSLCTLHVTPLSHRHNVHVLVQKDVYHKTHTIQLRILHKQPNNSQMTKVSHMQHGSPSN